MGLSKINKMIMDAFKGEKGSSKNLIILTGASLVSGYLFQAITLANIQEQEREAHYYNATQMAVTLEAKIQERMSVLSSDTKETVLEGFLRGSDGHAFAQEYTLSVLEELNMIKVAPDATATRINGDETNYDSSATKVQVMFGNTTSDGFGLVSAKN